jgi:flavin-dependent dehydrogenase
LIRRRVFALSNVEALEECDVENLVATSDGTRITGVTLIRRNQGRQRETLSAGLVVDAGGRGASSPKWLEALGYGRPEEEAVTVNVGYATRIYRRDPADPMYKKWIFITPEAPRERRAGGAFPIEEDRWLVTLGGWAGDHSPPDEPGFLEFAKNLPAPDIYHLISRNEPLSEIVTHKFPSSLRRRYDRMRRFPEGYLVMGDAACSFNPLYGQGMSVAALQAADLDQLLHERFDRQEGLQGIAKPFFQRAAKSIQNPWEIAVGEDFRFPETVGKRSPATSFINGYMDWIHRATHHDQDVCHAFVRVMNLLAPPRSLFRPWILWRAFRYGRAASTSATRQLEAPAGRSQKRDPLETTDETT